MNPELVAVGLDLQFFAFRFGILLIGEIAKIMHALQDVLLARFGALWIDDRIVGRGGLRQASQHGRFGGGDIFEQQTEKEQNNKRETEDTQTQKKLVHVY